MSDKVAQLCCVSDIGLSVTMYSNASLFVYVKRVQRRSSGTQNRPAPGAGRPKPRPQPKPKEKLPECRCLYGYEARDTDELSFTEGDVIGIVHEGQSLICFSLIYFLLLYIHLYSP